MMVYGDFEPGPERHFIAAGRIRLTPLEEVGPGLLTAASMWMDGLRPGATGTQAVRALALDGETHAVVAWSEDRYVTAGDELRVVTFPFRFPLGSAPQWRGGPMFVGWWAGSGTVIRFAGTTDSEALDASINFQLPPPPTIFSSTASNGSVFVLTSGAQTIPDVPEEELAAAGWPTAQGALSGPLGRTRVVASAEWHHTSLHEAQGAFALVREGGPLEELVGDVLRVTRGKRSVFVYVADASDDMDEDLSLSRRAFLALGPLSADSLRVTVEVAAYASPG